MSDANYILKPLLSVLGSVFRVTELIDEPAQFFKQYFTFLLFILWLKVMSIN